VGGRSCSVPHDSDVAVEAEAEANLGVVRDADDLEISEALAVALEVDSVALTASSGDGAETRVTRRRGLRVGAHARLPSEGRGERAPLPLFDGETLASCESIARDDTRKAIVAASQLTACTSSVVIGRERARIEAGQVFLNDKPGFGVEIDWDFVARNKAA
jgi:hypothetical protein